jgi:hypothetical protein
VDANTSRAAELKTQRDKFQEWTAQQFAAFRAGGEDRLDALLTVARSLEFGGDYIDELIGQIKEARRQRDAPKGFTRRNFGPVPEPDLGMLEALIERHGVKTSEEAEAEGPEAEAWADAEADAEAEAVEDAEDAANNKLLQIERFGEALGWVAWSDWMATKVAGVLLRISKDDQAAKHAAMTAWSKWCKAREISEDEATKVWARGARAPFTRIEEIWGAAQRAGWRFKLATGLNRLDRTMARAEAALIRGGAEIYQSGVNLVRIVADEVEATKGRKTRVARLMRIDAPWLKAEMTKHIDWFRWKSKGFPEPAGPPGEVTAAMLSGFGRWQFPVVNGVICCPTLRRDGSVLAMPGLDPASGLLVVGPLPEMRRVADKPTRADALEALGILKDLLKEFKFVDGACRSAALSGIVSPVVRGALDCVPMHAVTAPKPGSGKSYLLDVIAGVNRGDAMPIMSAGKDKEELEKRLGSHLLKGINMLSVDNVGWPMGGDALCQAIERPMVSLRILTKSEMPERRNAWCLYASGNNLRLKDDVTRRVLLIRIDRREEQPEKHRYHGHPFDDVLRRRGRYLWACLTLVRAYIVAGKPERQGWIGDPFGQWSDLVRSSLMWLGEADPVATMDAVRENDPARQARAQMWAAMRNAYGVGVAAARTTGEMVADAKSGKIKLKGPVAALLDQPAGEDPRAVGLREAITTYTSDRLDAQYLGNKLATHRDDITDGLQLCSDYDRGVKINRWFVVRA